MTCLNISIPESTMLCLPLGLGVSVSNIHHFLVGFIFPIPVIFDPRHDLI